MRYLIGTKKHVLYFKAAFVNGRPVLQCYSDASFEPTRAQTGIATFFASMLVDWRSIKQAQPPRSTGEAELTGLATSNLSLEGLEALLHSMFIDVMSCLYGDNEASIAMSHGQFSWRTRCLTNRAAALKYRIKDGTIALSYMPTSEMKADGLTKFLSVVLMAKMRASFHIVPS